MDNKTEKEKISKYPQVRIGAGICTFVAIVILVLAGVASLDVGAIHPPKNDSPARVFYGTKPDAATGALIVDYVKALYDLDYFLFGDFIAVASPSGSSSCRLYVVNNASSIAISSTGIQFSGMSYYFTTGGFEQYSTSQANTATFSEILCYVDPNTGQFIDNSTNYITGTSAPDGFISYVNSWLTFYNKVWNYDTNIQNSINAGFAQGHIAGVVQGREEGYETGYDEGYDNGYEDGESEGYESGYFNGLNSGLTQGREQGYETGYDDGFQDGYETGYDDGYEVGVENGEGSTTIVEITEEIDVGSIISALPEGAKAIINGAFGFEIFGINVAGTLSALLVVAIVGFVVKWLLSLKS